MLFADLLSLHLVTFFNVFFILVMITTFQFTALNLTHVQLKMNASFSSQARICLVVLTPNLFPRITLQMLLVSLVPRPFPPPVFDRLQYANTEGEDLVTCGYVKVDQTRQYQ